MTRLLLPSLAVFLFGAPVLADDVVRQSAREIPLVRHVDVVVVGGTTAAVAAAVEAASFEETDTSVLLVASRTYLGEDMCATLQLWLKGGETPRGELIRRIYGDKRITTPMRVKQTLERALLEAGVEVLFGSYPTDVLCGGDNWPAGIVIANRAGRQAIAAGVIIDATDRAVIAKLAGADFHRTDAGPALCTRVVLTGMPDAFKSRMRPKRSVLAEIEDDSGAKLFYHQFELTLDLSDGRFPSLAAAEHKARDLTYCDGQLRSAERLSYVAPDPIVGRTTSAEWRADDPSLGHFLPDGLQRVYVLSGSADVPRDQANELLRPARFEMVARRVGRAAAQEASETIAANAVDLTLVATEPVPHASESNDVRETLRGLRSTGRAAQSVSLPESSVPVLARADVVVVGGGASGACAAIAAARRGADVLLVEYQEGLGGVGTMGLIGRPYHGRNLGFTAEVPFCDDEHNTEYKMEWFRRAIREAGGRVWLMTLGVGAVVRTDDGRPRVCGLVVATPLGRGVVLAPVVIDATGSADIAIAAGADFMYGGDANDVALQGTGLPTRPLGKSYVNTDYLLVDESDMIDVARAFLGTRMTVAGTSFDWGPFIQTRERRRVVGRHVLSYLDQIAGRTYPDSVVLSGSDYDSHGYPSEPYFALIPHTAKTLRANHPAPGGTCYTPYRCMLPQGVEGLLTIGLGISMRRDASAMVRMQKDMHNQGYAAGVAAAMAAERRIVPSEIDVKALQRHLVEIGNLPESVLTDEDSFPLPEGAVRAAVADMTAGDMNADAKVRSHRCKALAVVMSHPRQAIPVLREAFASTSSSAEARLTYAKTLGFLGENDGLPLLLAELEGSQTWDKKILQGGMAEYAHLPTPMDALILALGYSSDRRALPALLASLDRLDEGVTLSHHRAVALALEQLADPTAAEPIARLLEKPGMRGHVMLGVEPLYDSPPAKRRREGPLREIVWARALIRCGDYDGLGRQILEEYRHDVRGLLARHAEAVLSDGP